jgi:hypothetical protein
MAIFNERVKHLLQHSVQQFVIVAFMLLGAIGLTFIEDWLRTSNRPKWLIDGVQLLSIMLFLIDSIVIISVFAIIGYRIVQGYIRDEEL